MEAVEKGENNSLDIKTGTQSGECPVKSDTLNDFCEVINLQNKNLTNIEKTADAAVARSDAKSICRIRSACPICGSDQLIHSCHVVQDNKKAGCESENLPILPSQACNIMGPATEEGCSASFIVIHLGSATIDRRFPPKSIMPWVMAEVKRSRDTFKEVSLMILSHTIKAVAYDDCASRSVRTVFEHKLHGISRFAKTHQDPRCFGYLRRDSLYSDFECHVFLAYDEKVVCIYNSPS